MKSDIYVEKTDFVPGFEKQIQIIAALQASREEPRKLVAVFPSADDNQLVLVFELA